MIEPHSLIDSLILDVLTLVACCADQVHFAVGMDPVNGAHGEALPAAQPEKVVLPQIDSI